MSISLSGSLSATSSPQVYSEVEDLFTEATESDLLEYAHRIGIDPEKEQHLLFLANEGLMKRLPSNWKPCFEPYRKAWYYYDSDTQMSQWEHPMDAVYRQKVIEARTENGMNRIQNFDPTMPKLKNLPPLRMSGGRLKPLAPLGSKTSLGNLSNENSDFPFNEPLITPKPKLQPLSIPTVQVKKPSGLVVTGGGASFLKSAVKTDSSDSNLSSEKKESLKEGGFVNSKLNSGVLTLGSPKQSSLKGISGLLPMNRSLFDDPSSSLTNWDLNPSIMTAQEKKLWKSLEDSETRRPKGSVKFRLDEDPEIKFETSSNSEKFLKEDELVGTDTGESLTGTEAEEDSEDNSKSEDFHREKAEKPYKPILSGSSNTLINGRNNNNTSIPVSLPETKAISSLPPRIPAASQLGAGEKESEKELNDSLKFAKDELRDKMERDLQLFKDALELERKQKENHMKKHLEEILEDLRVKNEESIKSFKSTLEKEKYAEMEKIKKELETTYISTIGKFKAENEEKLRAKKSFLLEEHKEMLHDLYLKLNDMTPEEEVQEMRKVALEKQEKDLEQELKTMKETMREEQIRQAQQMKDSHASFLYKLKGEFKAEEDKVRLQQSQLVAEIVARHEKEGDDKIQKLRAGQEEYLAGLLAEYELKKRGLELRLSESSLVGSEDQDEKKPMVKVKASDSPRQKESDYFIPNFQKSSDIEAKELELLNVKLQYEELQYKYKILKQSFRNLVSTEKNRSNQSNGNVMLNTSYLEVNAGRGDLVISSSESEDAAGTSLDITGSDMRKVVRKNRNTNARINQIRGESEERANEALSALELIREQIMDIKSHQDNWHTNGENESRNSSAVENGKKSIKKNSSSNVFPTSRRNSDTLRKGNTNSVEPVVKGSRSATNLKSIMRKGHNEGQDDISEEEERSRHLVVEEAKDFIKSQKRRLSRNIPGFGLNPSLQRGPILLNKEKGQEDSLTNFLNRKEYLYSETESSGLGSLRSLPPVSYAKDKAQVSKEIETILVSLKTLDKQMKYLWCAVGRQSQSQNFDSNSRLVDSSPVLLSPLIHPVSPPALSHLARFSQTNYANHIRSGGTLSSTTNELNSRYSLGPQFFSDANTNLMQDLNTLSTGNFNLEEHVNNMRNSQQARLAQLPGDEMSATLREKTKDLREWLEKF